MKASDDTTQYRQPATSKETIRCPQEPKLIAIRRRLPIVVVRDSSGRNSNFIIVKAPQRNKLSIRTVYARPTPSPSLPFPSQAGSKHAKTWAKQTGNSRKELYPHPIALERQEILRLSNPVCGRRQAVDSRENESGSRLWNGVWTITQDQSE